MSIYNLFLSTLKQKGNLAYEYHPLHNYQIDQNLYEIDTAVGKILVPYGCAVDRNTGEIVEIMEKQNKRESRQTGMTDKRKHALEQIRAQKNSRLSQLDQMIQVSIL